MIDNDDSKVHDDAEYSSTVCVIITVTVIVVVETELSEIGNRQTDT